MSLRYRWWLSSADLEEVGASCPHAEFEFTQNPVSGKLNPDYPADLAPHARLLWKWLHFYSLYNEGSTMNSLNDVHFITVHYFYYCTLKKATRMIWTTSCFHAHNDAFTYDLRVQCMEYTNALSSTCTPSARAYKCRSNSSLDGPPPHKRLVRCTVYWHSLAYQTSNAADCTLDVKKFDFHHMMIEAVFSDNVRFILQSFGQSMLLNRGVVLFSMYVIDLSVWYLKYLVRIWELC